MGANTRRHIDYVVKNRSANSSATSKDIYSIWDEQKKMQIEDKKLQEELQRAKEHARQLKRTIRKHQIGEVPDTVSRLGGDSLRFMKQRLGVLIGLLGRNKKIAIPLGVVILIGVIALPRVLDRTSNATLGENTEKTENAALPREKPVFSMLYPAGKSASDFDVVRLSPDNNEPAYTFIDELENGNVRIQLTQQVVPANFNLQQTATEFQATNVITVDDVTVYHGVSESQGVQSLLFIKDDKLISIRSPRKIADDIWASYIAILK